MRPFQGSVWGCALLALAVGSGPAQAAWNNVFQVCCHRCRSAYVPAPPPVAVAPPVAAPACPAPCAPACPTPCPQQQCTTRYVQRCYYRPVVSYQQSFYYEPVTSYRTSYYYEPVTCYRYSCYYDPCTCCTQQVAQPVTSYRLRSQCCPVTSYLQRCALKPVTSYQQAFYYEPVTTCCTTTVGPPVACPPGGQAIAPSVAPAAPAVPPPQPPAVADAPGAAAPPAVADAPGAAAPVPPAVGDQPGAPPYAPGVSDAPGGAGTSRYRPYAPNPAAPRMPQVNEYSVPQQQGPVTSQPAPPAQPRRMRPDRIASLPGQPMQGQVVGRDWRPQQGTTVVFLRADNSTARQSVTTDEHGRFQIKLASGGWLVYVQGQNGKMLYQETVNVRANVQAQPMTFVRR